MDLIKLHGGGFPLTTQRLEFLQQTYTKAISQLTNIVGDGNVIIEGAVKSSQQLPDFQVTDGVVVVDKEIIEFRGGDFHERVALFEEVINVPYNEDVDGNGSLDLKAADTIRYLMCAENDGVEVANFSSFRRYGNIQLNAPFIGEVKRGFFGMKKGWIPCDGRLISREMYPELSSFLGFNFGGSIESGLFGVPNYDGKFSMGNDSSRPAGSEGGNRDVVISRVNLPSFDMSGSTSEDGTHSHEHKDGYHIESTASPNDTINGYDSEFIGTGFSGASGNDNDNQFIWYKTRQTEDNGSHSHSVAVSSGGGDQPLDVTPPYIADYVYIFAGYID